MTSIVSDIQSLANQCNCGNPHKVIEIEEIVVEKGALSKAVDFMDKKKYQQVMIIADQNTYKACGEKLATLLKQKNQVFSSCLVESDENGDVLADEKALVQVLLEASSEVDVMVAVGSGTLHDITRFCSAKMGIPFISVPTAPSVDGFTSLGAPIIVKGVKKTFQLTSPIAVFADIDILTAAPRKMIAAGVGDMLAKYTSLADWEFDSLVTGEPYCPLSAQITQDALLACKTNIDSIAAGDDEGIAILIDALIKSGLAMLLYGKSHPASGGEHHLSHYWEMEFMKENRKQVLHGAKVGVSTILLSSVYKEILLKALVNENSLEKADVPVDWKSNLRTNADETIKVYQQIPDTSEIIKLIHKVGGPVSPEELGINESLLLTSLQEAHHLRDRFTGLKFLSLVGENEFSSFLSVR